MLPRNDNMQFFLMHLDLRTEFREDYVKMGESKVGIGLQDG